MLNIRSWRDGERFKARFSGESPSTRTVSAFYIYSSFIGALPDLVYDCSVAGIMIIEVRLGPSGRTSLEFRKVRCQPTVIFNIGALLRSSEQIT